MKKKKKKTRRPAESIGTLFGVDTYDDSRLLRVIMCQLHYDAVEPPGDDGPPFPLADVADANVTNANLVVYLLRQHPDDERVHVIHHHRYFHRDSQDPSDGLDRKCTYGATMVVPPDRLESLVRDFCKFVANEQPFRLCAPPAVYDFERLPIDDAIDAFTQLPWCHTRVMVVPDVGVQ